MMEYIPTRPMPTAKIERISEAAIAEHYERFGRGIESKLREFRKLRKAPHERLFAELCFCILTPQSNALKCDAAIYDLWRSGLLLRKGRTDALASRLKGVRFWRNKASYISRARKRFTAEDDRIHMGEILEKVNELGSRETRDWLRDEMHGMGIGSKESSHFLRNIGHGDELAILDRHVLRCLLELEALSCVPESRLEKGALSDREYRHIEGEIESFADEIGIPMAALDLVLWSARTGYIFK